MKSAYLACLSLPQTTLPIQVLAPLLVVLKQFLHDLGQCTFIQLKSKHHKILVLSQKKVKHTCICYQLIGKKGVQRAERTVGC